MDTSIQTIDSAAGLAADTRLSGGEVKSAPALDPPYPFTVLAFDPLFFGTPESITAQDFQGS